MVIVSLDVVSIYIFYPDQPLIRIVLIIQGSSCTINLTGHPHKRVIGIGGHSCIGSLYSQIIKPGRPSTVIVDTESQFHYIRREGECLADIGPFIDDGSYDSIRIGEIAALGCIDGKSVV